MIKQLTEAEALTVNGRTVTARLRALGYLLDGRPGYGTERS